MDRGETLKIMAVMKAAYPTYYLRQSREEIEGVVILWTEMLQDLPYELVSIGLKNLIKTRTDTFPPNIGQLRESVSLITNNGNTDADMWNLIAKACRNGYYSSLEEFNKLPADCQQWVGSPESLRELSMIEPNVFNTVVKGQFLKTIQEIRRTGEVLRSLPFEVRNAIQSAKMDLLEATHER